MPTVSYSQTNYYVDVIYSAIDTTPHSVVSSTPLSGSTSMPATTTITATFSRNAQQSSIKMSVNDSSNAPVDGAISYDATQRRVTFTPSQPSPPGTTYTVHLTAAADDVGPMASPAVWTFTTALPDAVSGVCPCGLFNDGDVPDRCDCQRPEQCRTRYGVHG